MTADEFERQYAERSRVTVEQLRQFRTVRPCDCGANGCEGWQSISHERAKEYDLLAQWDAEPVNSSPTARITPIEGETEAAFMKRSREHYDARQAQLLALLQ